MTELRIAYFITDHFLGSQLPLGIVLDGPDGRKVVPNPRTPGERCVGGAAALYTWQRARTLLAQHTGDDLPEGVGPHVSLSGPIQLPDNVECVAYADALFARVADQPPGERGARGDHRATAGMRFLKNWGVDRHVKTRFRAGRSLPSAKALAPISHYVAGRETTLLLEPVAFDRRSLKRDLSDIAMRIGAYARALEVDGAQSAFGLKVYALEGGTREERCEAFDALGPFAQVVDLARPKARDTFLEEVRATGELGQVRAAAT